MGGVSDFTVDFVRGLGRQLDALMSNEGLLLGVFLAFCGALVAVRVASSVHVSGALAFALRDTAREIKSRADIGKIRNKLLRNAASEYIRVAEKAVTSVPTAQIVNRAVSGLGLFGWRYERLLPYVESLEKAAVWFGLVFAVAAFPNGAAIGFAAVAAHVLLGLSESVFGVRAGLARLSDETAIFLEREVGRFFASDSGGAVLRLKNDLTEAIDRQSAAYQRSMDGICGSMQETLKEVSRNMAAAADSIGGAVRTGLEESLKNVNKEMGEAFAKWEGSLAKARSLHESMNDSAEKISHAGHRLQVAAELLAAHMQGHSGALSGHLVALVDSIDSLKDGHEHLASHRSALERQAELVGRNLEAFERIAASYEESVQRLASSLGDGVGAYVGLHAAEAADSINRAMSANIDRLAALSGR